MPTTIQIIKEAEEKFWRYFVNSYDDIKIKSFINETLLAVFESELESVPPESPVPITEDEFPQGKYVGIYQERARLRSHLTEVINYLKQK